MNRLVTIAENIARAAHYGQYRRDGSTPYHVHPQAVAIRVSHEPDEVVATAWLHDVLEDTTFTAHCLLESGIPKTVVDAVDALSKRKGESYRMYLDRVLANPIAVKVKIADMLSNLADHPTDAQILKYCYGLQVLVSKTTHASTFRLGSP